MSLLLPFGGHQVEGRRLLASSRRGCPEPRHRRRLASEDLRRRPTPPGEEVSDLRQYSSFELSLPSVEATADSTHASVNSVMIGRPVGLPRVLGRGCLRRRRGPLSDPRLIQPRPPRARAPTRGPGHDGRNDQRADRVRGRSSASVTRARLEAVRGERSGPQPREALPRGHLVRARSLAAPRQTHLAFSESGLLPVGESLHREPACRVLAIAEEDFAQPPLRSLIRVFGIVAHARPCCDLTVYPDRGSKLVRKRSRNPVGRPLALRDTLPVSRRSGERHLAYSVFVPF